MTTSPGRTRVDTVPKDLNWDFWLGVAAERPFLADYYHPGEWRKRLDFGTGTFGDMGCHILDPVYTSLTLTAPSSIRSEGGAPNRDNWGLDSQGALRLSRDQVHDRDARTHSGTTATSVRPRRSSR